MLGELKKLAEVLGCLEMFSPLFWRETFDI